MLSAPFPPCTSPYPRFAVAVAAPPSAPPQRRGQRSQCSSQRVGLAVGLPVSLAAVSLPIAKSARGWADSVSAASEFELLSPAAKCVSVSRKSQVHLQDDKVSFAEPCGPSHRNLTVIHLPRSDSPLDDLLMSTRLLRERLLSCESFY